MTLTGYFFGNATFQVVVNFFLQALHAVMDCNRVAGDWAEEYVLQTKGGKCWCVVLLVLLGERVVRRTLKVKVTVCTQRAYLSCNMCRQ
jgi:hypothetical protein